MSEGRIVSNVASLTLARGVTAILAFVTTVYLARVLEPTAFGMLSWALAYFAYFRLLPDMGLSIYGVRELARAPDTVRPLVATMLPLRLALALAALALFGIGLFFLDLSPLFRRVVAIQAIGLLGIAISLEWVYQGLERMGLLAIRNVVAALLALIGALILVRGPEQVQLASLVMATALVGANVWLLVTYVREYRSLKLRPQLDAWKRMMRPALPIAIAIGLVAINVHLDQLMLGILRTTQEVGYYGAAYRILLAVGIPAQILLQAFLPALSNSYGNPSAMRQRGRIFARWLFVIGLPAGAVGILLAPELMGVFGAEYAPAVPAFTILMVHAALQYVHMAYGNPLIAWDHQKWYMWAIAASAVVNIAANLFLIPRYGIEGAAFATLGSEVVAVICLMWMHRKWAPHLYIKELVRGIIITGAVVFTTIVVRFVFEPSVVTIIAMMTITYVTMLFAFKMIRPSDILPVAKRVLGKL